MEKVGVLIVSYGSREAAIVDAFSRSQTYKTKLYIVDKQKNPFNVKHAEEHLVISDLNITDISKFAKKRKNKIDFGIVGPEKPIIEGVRDLVEKETDIPIICPTKQYAIEASKVAQRQLFQKVAPEANPKFKVFNPKDYSSQAQLKKSLYAWLDTLNNQVAVKPDRPAAGKGVGIWGDHFNSREQLFDHFLANYKQGSVIVEEKVDGEESSFQAFCDGRHLTALPETRDYKRAFDDDKGPNTGGMGSYKSKGDILPFMTTADREKEIELVNKVFDYVKKKADKTDLRGVPFYSAFIHTGKGPKLLENNSRPGDPEIQNLLPILKDDFVDLCYKILEGNLIKVNVEQKATVATYKAPPNYGGYDSAFSDRVNKADVNQPVDLSEAEKLSAKYGDNVRIYSGSMEIRDDGKFYALSSRAVCVVGIGDNIQAARDISLEGVRAVRGGALWHRNDIASKEHIKKSIDHMSRLRLQPP
jgi:phosphoribosylamine--glycine ligase